MRSRLGARLLFAALLGAAASPPAWAQDLPPGHPMPAGHPQVGRSEPPADVSEQDATLPAGTITASIVTPEGSPLPDTEVRLGIMFQKIAEGNSRSERFQKTDASGTTRFDKLAFSSDYSYRITVQDGVASYASMPFTLSDAGGRRVVLHVYPVTQDAEQAPIGMRGFLYVETRDDLFQFEVLFRVFNFGQVTWVPKDSFMRLPAGWKAFKATESMWDANFEADDAHGARLKGTFPPGQRDVSFRFQVPKENRESASFRVSLPPRVAEMRVLAEASARMELHVDGFEQPQVSANQNGQRILVTRRVLTDANDSLREVNVTLAGLPVPSSGRWIAVLLALGFAASGIGVARGWIPEELTQSGRPEDDQRDARDLLFQELLELEESKREGRIGPRAYEQAHRTLVDAIARLGTAAPRAAKRAPKRRRRARRTARRT